MDVKLPSLVTETTVGRAQSEATETAAISGPTLDPSTSLPFSVRRIQPTTLLPNSGRRAHKPAACVPSVRGGAHLPTCTKQQHDPAE
jgi:hypothetical protein